MREADYEALLALGMTPAEALAICVDAARGVTAAVIQRDYAVNLAQQRAQERG